VSGRLQQLNVDLGSPVQEGQVIAELSSGTLEAQLRQAQANLRNSEARLAALEAGIEPDRASAQSQLEAARASLERLVNPSPLDLQAAAGAADRAHADLETARTELRRLENPSESQLATARAAVAAAEGRLSRAQVAVNQAISTRLASVEDPVPSQVRRRWEMMLISRLHQQERVALLRNLQETYGLELTASEVVAALRSIEQNQVNISALMASIEDESSIPQQIREALWEEASAQSALADAQAGLRQLVDPDQDTLALAQHRVDAARGSLEAASAELELLQNPTNAAIAAATAEVAQAQRALALTQDDRVAHDVAAAQAEVERSRAGVDLANEQMSDTRIVAPFDGLVSRRWLSPGALVSPQTPIVTVSSLETVVSVQVEETAVSWLEEGQQVTLTSPILPGQRLEMVVDRVSPAGDQRDHTFVVQFRPVEDVPALRPGMSGQVMVETSREQSVLVPRQAVVYRNNRPVVFVVRDGIAHLQEVTLGNSGDEAMEIASGIQPGDQVVVSGQERLRHGDPVNVETPG
jgi:RND family efflux transporter MFP subunit